MSNTLPDWVQLQAYLDGELSPTAQTAFAERMAADPLLSAAVTTEQQARLLLRARLRRTPAPATLHAQVRRALTPAPAIPLWQRWWIWLSTPQPLRPLVGVAYTLLWLCLLSGLVWWLTLPRAETLAALDLLFQRHEIYFENQPALDVTGSAEQVSAWVAARLAHPLPVPLLDDAWQLQGARLDEFQQQVIAHLLYRRGNGQRTSITALPSRALTLPTTPPVRYAEQEFWLHDNSIHRAILWRSATHTYVLIGDMEVPLNELLDLALHARTQLP